MLPDSEGDAASIEREIDENEPVRDSVGTQKASFVVHLGFLPHDRPTRLNYFGCDIEFQHGNVWAAAYAKAIIHGGSCSAWVSVTGLRDGQLLRSTSFTFYSGNGWISTSVSWSNIVGSSIYISEVNTSTQHRVQVFFDGV